MNVSGARWITYGSRQDEFRLWNLADLHLLSRACAENDIRRDVEAIRTDPFSFWVGGGDYADFIGYTDKRFDPDSVADWVKVSDLGDMGVMGMRKVRDLLLPIKDKCLGLLLGNHEKRYELATHHESLHGWLCSELDTANLGYCCLFDLVFCRLATARRKPELRWSPPEQPASSWRVRIFLHHGAGYAATPGGKLNRLMQFMRAFDANLYLCGHVHDRVGKRDVIIGANDACDKLVSRDRVGLIAGSYLKTYAQGVCTYGEQRGYLPTALGPAVARIRPDRKWIGGEV